MINGIERTHDYYVPDRLGTSSIPLIFLLHGGGSKSANLTGERGHKAPYKIWMDIADKERFIIVYPNGSQNPLGV